jgi:hypothetical protein
MSPILPQSCEAPIVSIVPAPSADSTFDARWQARGARHEHAVRRRRLHATAVVLVIGAALPASALRVWGGA